MTASGVLGSYFGLRTLNTSAGDVIVIGTASVPVSVLVTTGSAGESLEGLRLSVSGVVTEAPSMLSDGLGVTVDDGSGPIRTVISSAAQAGATIATGDLLTVTGPLGQRDSSGTGSAGYRVHATEPGEAIVSAPASPSPSSAPASASPHPSIAPGPSATPAPTPITSPSPTPVIVPVSIGDARRQPIGTTVVVTGVVTAEAGRLGSAALIAIQDRTAGMVVHLPNGVAAPSRGATVEVRGRLADPYGQIEIRPTSADIRLLGTSPLPLAAIVDSTSLGESSEGRLVATTGVLQARPSRATSGDLSLELRGPAGPIKVVADSSSGLTQGSFVVGATYEVSGVAGQRASHKGAADGYRIWLRDPGDVRRQASPIATQRPSSSPASSTAPQSTTSIAAVIRAGKGTWTVEGIVTIAPDLLDASGRRIVIEDRTAGLEILVATDASVPSVGSRIRVVGAIGRAWDAPRLKATRIDVLGTGQRPVPVAIGRPPTAALEWRLARVAGTVAELHKLGDRWRAELAIGSQRVVVSGLAGARIPVTTLAVGRRVTVVGLVRRPYPGATDRRWSVVPRNQADLMVSGGSGGDTGSGGGAIKHAGPSPHVAGQAGAVAALDIDLVGLGQHLGRSVRVGGLVASIVGDGFMLDDGTAVGRIRLAGSAAEYVALLEPGDAVNATGRVAADGAGHVLVVDDAGGLVRAGDPDEGGGAAATVSEPGPPAAAGEAGPPIPGPSAATGSMLAGGLLDGALPGAAGVLGLVLASAVSVAVTALRRYRTRRLEARRMASRLATFAGAGGGKA